MSDVNEDVKTILEAAVELQDLWHQEQWTAAFSPTGDGTRSGSTTPDPTGARAMTDGKWTDADRIADRIAAAAQLLSNAVDRFSPKPPSGECGTKGCRGTATHQSRCAQCWRWMQANRHTGMTPDHVVYDEKDDDGKPTGRKRTLVDDWNERRKNDCTCLGWISHPETGEALRICPDHEGTEGDRCWKSAQDGRLVCDRCRARAQSVRTAEREAS